MEHHSTRSEVTTSVIRAPRPRRKLEGLAELLERRVDLRGAYPPADYLEEAIRWSA